LSENTASLSYHYSTMASTISDYLSSVAPSSRVEAPSEIQLPIDLTSDRGTISVEADLATAANTAGLDWSRLQGFELPPNKTKRQRVSRSYVWQYGWRLYKPTNGHEYWVCKLCHSSNRKPSNPANFALKCTKATTASMNHLRDYHRLGPYGILTEELLQASVTSGGQSLIDGYCEASAERNRAAAGFDSNVFNGLLTKFFVEEQIALLKMDSKAFRDLLIYLQPYCERVLPTRGTIRKHIASAYDRSLALVESNLQRATTKINLSFDLWTSPGRRLSLLGVVAHYLDHRFEPRALLLAMPRMQGSHTAVNLSQQLSKLISYFNLKTSIGYAITDNASENRVCINLLATELDFDASKRHVLCIGYIINLVAHKVLFGSDIESFEEELEASVTTETIELVS
jgi:hypothetical protein